MGRPRIPGLWRDLLKVQSSLPQTSTCHWPSRLAVPLAFNSEISRDQPQLFVFLLVIFFVFFGAQPWVWEFALFREAPVRFGYGSGVHRFERFRFSVPAVPLQKGGSLFQYSLTGKDGSGSDFGFLESGSGGSGSAFGFGKTVPTVPVPGSGSVP